MLRRDMMAKVYGKDKYPPCHLASSFAHDAELPKMVWFQSAHHPEDIAGPRIVRSATSGGAAADPRVSIVYE
jgi:hypothetical protein